MSLSYPGRFKMWLEQSLALFPWYWPDPRRKDDRFWDPSRWIPEGLWSWAYRSAQLLISVCIHTYTSIKFLWVAQYSNWQLSKSQQVVQLVPQEQKVTSWQTDCSVQCREKKCCFFPWTSEETHKDPLLDQASDGLLWALFLSRPHLFGPVFSLPSPVVGRIPSALISDHPVLPSARIPLPLPSPLDNFSPTDPHALLFGYKRPLVFAVFWIGLISLLVFFPYCNSLGIKTVFTTFTGTLLQFSLTHRICGHRNINNWGYYKLK